MQGTIKRLMDKGYGFIASDEIEKDVFFHSSELKDVEFNSLQEGTKVSFDTEETDKGLNAVNIKLA
ncbi:cold-shock protein [Patescibacteria group bacterium]